jgi:Protein of unknown function (DUF1194)
MSQIPIIARGRLDPPYSARRTQRVGEDEMPQSGRVRRRWLVKSVNRAGTAALGWRIVAAIIALAALRSPAAGEPVGVDLQLVIAIDVSASMNESRRRVQREGYARAFRSAEVLAAIKSGPHGRIAIACFGWASPDYQRVIAPWTIVETRADADTVAHAIEKEPLASEGGTSISAALLFSERLLHAAGVRADRKIIDVSGDGPNNSGPLLRLARDSVLADGVTINGLAIALLTKEERTFEPFAPTTIRSYYQDCVIGGAGAFVIEVAEVGDFEPAIRTKLTREIAEMHPLTQRVAYVSKHPLAAGCEKGSRRRR